MKIISSVFVLFAMCAIVEGAWLAVANRIIEPLILSCGTLFAAKIGSDDNLNSDPFGMKDWFKKFPWSSDDDFEPKQKSTFNKEELVDKEYILKNVKVEGKQNKAKKTIS